MFAVENNRETNIKKYTDRSFFDYCRFRDGILPDLDKVSATTNNAILVVRIRVEQIVVEVALVLILLRFWICPFIRNIGIPLQLFQKIVITLF